MSQDHANFGGLPLLSLRAFEAAARRRSFREGAAEIGLTPSAISHHVRQLEATLGTALFRRLHRQVVPTAAGEDLAAATGAAMRLLAAAFSAARTRRGCVVVSATPSFAARWLMPAAAALRAEGIVLQVEGTAATADVEGGVCDVAIRLGPRPPSWLSAERLIRSPAVLVAAPERLAGRDALTPEEIASGPLLALSLNPGFWGDALKRLGVAPRTLYEARFDTFDAVLQAAEAGHGIAFAPEIVVADRLEAGALMPVHPRRFGYSNGWSYWFVTRPEIADQHAVRRLRQWLAEVFAPRA